MWLNEVRGGVATATEIVPGAHDGSANPADFSVFVRSYASEVLLASSGSANSGNETYSRSFGGFRGVLLWELGRSRVR